MQRDNARSIQGPALPPQTLYRGLYIRIAKRLEIDPSYVSRVARGERHSKPVELALRHEIDQINKKLAASNLGFAAKTERVVNGKRLRFFVTRNRRGLREEWLQQSQADPNLKRIKVTTQSRAAPVLPLIEEALKAMKFSLKEMATLPLKSATQHGCARLAQGYKSRHLLEEYNLIRRCVFALAEENLVWLDNHFLIHDLGQFGEVLDLQSQKALEAFIGDA